MKSKKYPGEILPVFLCVTLLSGCAQGAADTGLTQNTGGNTTATTDSQTEIIKSQQAVSGTSETAAPIVTAGSSEAALADFDSLDYPMDWKSEKYTSVDLSAGSFTVTESGYYRLTGSLTDGSVTVNTADTDEGCVYLILDNAQITSQTSAPLYITSAKKVVLLLEEGTVNTLTQDTNVVTDEKGNPSSAVYSKSDLTITGNGALHVISRFQDGITCKDELKITGGNINITAVSDGITGKDLVAVENGSITIEAGKDGIRSTNATDEGKGNIAISGGTFTIAAANDCIQSEWQLSVTGGAFTLISGGGYTGESIQSGEEKGRISGGFQQQTSTQSSETETEESRKSLKAGEQFFISGGTFTISSYEDALHSNGDITISGGTFSIQCGDDGIHADQTLTVQDGTLSIASSYEGMEASNISLNGGTIHVTSMDDGVNVNSSSGSLTVSGGELYIEAGGDGLDSNGNLVQTGGSVVINIETTGNGDTPVDYDGTFTSSGGTLTDQNGSAISTEGGMNQKGGGGAGGRGGRMSRTTPPESTMVSEGGSL